MIPELVRALEKALVKEEEDEAAAEVNAEPDVADPLAPSV